MREKRIVSDWFSSKRSSPFAHYSPGDKKKPLSAQHFLLGPTPPYTLPHEITQKYSISPEG
jgi:hypothetical protein